MTDFSHIKGMRELAEALQQIPVKLERNVLRSAMTAGSRELRLEARANVPVRTGKLKRAIRSKSPTSRGGTTRGGITTGGRGGAMHAHWVEFGTAAHLISASGKKMRVGGGFASVVQHPGSRPKPYMRPAYDSKGDDAVRAFGEKIRRVLAAKYGIDVPQPMEDDDLVADE